MSDEHERAIFGLAFRPPSAQPHAWGDWQTLMGGHPAYVPTHTQGRVCLECGAVQRRTVHAGTQAVISVGQTLPRPAL